MYAYADPRDEHVDRILNDPVKCSSDILKSNTCEVISSIMFESENIFGYGAEPSLTGGNWVVAVCSWIARSSLKTGE